MRLHLPAFAAIALTAVMSSASVAHSEQLETFSGPGVIVTRSGPVRGTLNATTIAFLGIPYAEPPVGELRWRAPQPFGRWTGVLEATHFGKHCPQLPPGNDPDASEACLFLNVYVPREAEVELLPSSGHPVMVYIPGGGHVTGSANLYDPTPLMDTGKVIAVTLNYRLGPLGFLAHPTFESANFGVMDQQLALSWVRTNIAAFGGDPGNVTVFGESAGGLDTLTHLVSPLSKGLMERAIVQSGAYGLRSATLSQSESLGLAFATAIGCSDQTAACLRSKPVEAVMQYGATAFNQSTVDGTVLPESQIDALGAGHVNRVPIIQSVNSHEARFLLPPTLTVSGYQATAAGVAAATGKPIDQIIARYPVVSSPFEAASEIYGDAAFACTAEVSSQLLTGAGVRTYLAHFDDPGASSLGAMHTAELKYLFNLNLGGSIVGPSSLPAPSQSLASTMRAYWTRFASSGNPNSPGQPEWRPISDGLVQSLVAPVPAAQSLAVFRSQHQCAFWD